jgi:hypothetical protein
MKKKKACEVVAKYDRVGFTSTTVFRAARTSLLLSGFRVVRDHSLNNVNADFFQAPYGRACELSNEDTGTRVFVKYRPRFRNLAPMRIDVAPDDVRGLRRPELETILQSFAPYSLRSIEIALDFARKRR